MVLAEPKRDKNILKIDYLEEMVRVGYFKDSTNLTNSS
jgi:hypothetical protein